ncbi:MAG: hypothetical protein LQ348_007077 [Seirophora lacunosa]|nr:MAG: hypothetical protein LQ348_007077 [Seirophora lacunosa]
MALQILPYSVDHYNSLPELGVAKEQFDSAQVLDVLFTEIGGVFLKHHVENTLGIALLHNHFLLEPNEMLVHISDSAAVPWDTTSGAKELSEVKATAWRFTDQGLAPYEFAHAAAVASLDRHPIPSFLVDLAVILQKFRLSNILGLCSLGATSVDEPATMEFTEGRVNITLPFDIAPNDGSAIDAMWQFSSNSLSQPAQALLGNQAPENDLKVAKGACKMRCKGKPHAKRHLTKT